MTTESTTSAKSAPKTIHKTIEVQLADIEKSADGAMRAVITAEVADADGDIVVVKGMSWSRYDQSNPMPVLSSHLRKLPDGKPPQIGFATNIMRTQTVLNGQTVPAVVMEWQWLDTELAREWQEVARKMGRLSFSVGASVTDSEPIEKNGVIEGFRFKATELTEVSVVTIPANPAALSVKAERAKDTQMTQTQIDKLIKGNEKLDETLLQLMASVDAIESRLDEIASRQTAVAHEADKPGETIKSQPSDNNLSDSDNDLSERLSVLLNKIKTIKTKSLSAEGEPTEKSTNGTNGDTTESL